MGPEVAAELHRINLVGYMLNVIHMRAAEIEPWLDANAPGWRTAPRSGSRLRRSGKR